jgi:hypothetical protein
MSLAVPLILWAGLKLGATTNPEYFTLGIGIAANSKPWRCWPMSAGCRPPAA